METTASNQIDADSLLWNWARWCWHGETVGNMTPYVSWEDDFRPINHEHARAVDALHRKLPHHEGMVVTAEYPQKNAMFGDLHGKARMEAACRWIRRITGVRLTEHEYGLYLGLFKDEVGRKLI